MSMLQRSRRVVAISSHRVLLVIGILGLVLVPFTWADDGIGLAIAVFLLAMLVVAMSVQLARSLDVQRTVRRLTPPASPRRVVADAAPVAGGVTPVAVKPQPTKSQPVPGKDVTRGRVLVGYGADQLPVIGFAILDMPQDNVRKVIHDVAEHQLLAASFKPLLILDEPYFGPARGYGFPAELIIPARTWSGSQAERAQYLGARLNSLRHSYGCAGVIRVPASGLDDFGRAQVDHLATEWAARYNVALPGTKKRPTPPATSITASPIPQPLDPENSGLLVGGKQVTS